MFTFSFGFLYLFVLPRYLSYKSDFVIKYIELDFLFLYLSISLELFSGVVCLAKVWERNVINREIYILLFSSISEDPYLRLVSERTLHDNSTRDNFFAFSVAAYVLVNNYDINNDNAIILYLSEENRFH